MKRLVLMAAVVLVSIPILAGEYLMNEEVAFGLRVTFSEPVTITHFGDVLDVMSPEGEATEFVFSGAELPAWVGHGLAWTPASARIVDYEWLESVADSDNSEWLSDTWLPTHWSQVDWDSVPHFFRYPPGVGVSFWTSDQRDISESEHRTKAGLDVSGVKLILTDSWMAIRFEGYSTVQGVFEYQLRFTEGDWGPTTYYVTLRPSARVATVARSKPWESLGELPVGRMRTSETAASAVVLPSDLGVSDFSFLRNWQVGTHAHFEEEWFTFPGRGPYSGFEALVAGQRESVDDLILASDALLRSSNPDEHPDWLYRYLEADCRPAPPYQVPVYVSVPLLTPDSDRFELALSDGSRYSLDRLDASTLGCLVELPEVPATLSITIERNGQAIARQREVAVTNAWQAIPLAISELEAVRELTDLPENFVKGGGPCDVWGSYLYGIEGEGWSTHLRTHVCSTFERLARMGVTDLFVTSFVGWDAVYPDPRLGYVFAPSGTETIGLLDLMKMVDAAHSAGLSLNLIYNGVSGHNNADTSYLREPNKPEEWVEEAVDQYRRFAVAEATKAEEYGADGFKLGFGDSALDASGQAAVWASAMATVIAEVREVFDGTLYLSLGQHGVIPAVNGEIPTTLFEDIDAVVAYYDHSWYSADSTDDSIAALFLHVRNSLLNLAALKRLIGKPVILTANILSYDGYVDNGWYETIGLPIIRTTPDFLEQSHVYEALLLFSSAYSVIDGVTAYMYHWDDPFGPELCEETIAQVDLSGSMRNKPAEAALMRWFAPVAVDGLQCPELPRTYD